MPTSPPRLEGRSHGRSTRTMTMNPTHPMSIRTSPHDPAPALPRIRPTLHTDSPGVTSKHSSSMVTEHRIAIRPGKSPKQTG